MKKELSTKKSTKETLKKADLPEILGNGIKVVEKDLKKFDTFLQEIAL